MSATLTEGYVGQNYNAPTDDEPLPEVRERENPLQPFDPVDVLKSTWRKLPVEEKALRDVLESVLLNLDPLDDTPFETMIRLYEQFRALDKRGIGQSYSQVTAILGTIVETGCRMMSDFEQNARTMIASRRHADPTLAMSKSELRKIADAEAEHHAAGCFGKQNPYGMIDCHEKEPGIG